MNRIKDLCYDIKTESNRKAGLINGISGVKKKKDKKAQGKEKKDNREKT